MRLKVNFEQIFSAFFKLKDWQERTAYFAGIQTLSLLVYFVLLALGMFTMIIPIVGWFIACVFYLLATIIVMAVPLFISGYKMDMAEALLAGKQAETVKINHDIGGRMITGLKLALASLVYLAPVIILTVLFVFLFIALIAATAEGSDLAALSAMMIMFIWFAVIIISAVIILFVQFLVLPVLQVIYIASGRDLSALFDYTRVWRLCKLYVWDLVAYGLLLMLIGIVFSIVLDFAFFLIFLLVGLIIVPLLMGLFSAYTTQAQAEFISQLAKKESR